MNSKKINIGIFDIVLLVLSVIFFIGSKTFFKACDPMENGNWMSCHWANQAITGLAAVLSVIAIIHLFLPNAKLKAGLGISVIPICILTAILPGNLINLCMMNTMRCHAVMQSATIAFSVVILIAAALDVFTQIKKSKAA